MPKSTKSSAQWSRPVSPSEEDVINTQEEISSSEHEDDPEVSFHPHQLLQPSPSWASQPQPAAGMHMPYIEGPHMDWTVNDNLYHRFLKLHLKCENILECELTALPECQQCKKVIVKWSLGPVWLTDEFQTRKLQCWWVVQCHTSTSEFSQIPPGNSQNAPQGHLLVLLKR